MPALLGAQWEEAVPFMQAYCMVYALLPIHTTNLQALNGMGRSDLFLRLELVKKAYGIAALLFCAFVLNDVRALVVSYLVTGVISTFVNAWPNKRVIGYSYGEQVRDIAPAFLLSGAASLRRPAWSHAPASGPGPPSLPRSSPSPSSTSVSRQRCASRPSPTCCAPRAASSCLASSGAYVPIRRGCPPRRGF